MRCLLLLGGLFLLTGSNTFAATLSAVDQGWYNSDGLHQPAEVSYFAGFQNSFSTPVEYRNFFEFNLAGISQLQAGAVLRAFAYQSGGFNNGGSGLPITWTIFDVSTNLTTLTQGTGGLSAFNDLGSGQILGSALVSQDTTDYGSAALQDRGRYIDVVLNSAGIAYLNAHLGTTVAFGGSIARVNGADNWLFGNSQIALSFHPPSLVTSVVPIPYTARLFGSALGVMGVMRRKISS